MIDFWQTIGGISAKRAMKLSEGDAWIKAFKYDQAFRRKAFDLIRVDQLKNRGVDEDGEVIGYYSFVTSLINPKKKFNTHYTLEDTGELFRSLLMNVTADFIELDWNDEKLLDQNWYDDKILGFTDENIEVIAQEFVHRLRTHAISVLFDNL